MAEIFISWSGGRSREVAIGLKQWLEELFAQRYQAWMSEHDIQAGARWGEDLSAQLESSNFGIVCLTAENIGSPWITFESGALSKAIDEARVVPYRFDLKATDVGPPLSQFQGVDADKAGSRKLVESINAVFESPLTNELLDKTFEKWWPDLEEVLDAIPEGPAPAPRPDREILEEILETVRRTSSRELQNVLTRILAFPNVLNIRIAPKRVAGEETDAIALKVMVREKLPLAKIPEQQRIPTSVYGMPTDVEEAQA